MLPDGLDARFQYKIDGRPEPCNPHVVAGPAFQDIRKELGLQLFF